jgi:hypothetical protein
VRSEHPASARAHRYRDDHLSEREPLFGIPAPTLFAALLSEFLCVIALAGSGTAQPAGRSGGDGVGHAARHFGCDPYRARQLPRSARTRDILCLIDGGIVSLFVGIPHSINCDGAVNADAHLRDATSSRAPSPHPWTASSDRYAGRDQISIVGVRRNPQACTLP